MADEMPEAFPSPLITADSLLALGDNSGADALHVFRVDPTAGPFTVQMPPADGPRRVILKNRAKSSNIVTVRVGTVAIECSGPFFTETFSTVQIASGAYEWSELEALRWRADAGIIPYRLYAALSPTAQARLGALSPTAAKRRLGLPRA